MQIQNQTINNMKKMFANNGHQATNSVPTSSFKVQQYPLPKVENHINWRQMFMGNKTQSYQDDNQIPVCEYCNSNMQLKNRIDYESKIEILEQQIKVLQLKNRQLANKQILHNINKQELKTEKYAEYIIEYHLIDKGSEKTDNFTLINQKLKISFLQQFSLKNKNMRDLIKIGNWQFSIEDKQLINIQKQVTYYNIENYLLQPLKQKKQIQSKIINRLKQGQSIKFDTTTGNLIIIQK